MTKHSNQIPATHQQSALMVNLMASLLILLWVYTALSKLADLAEFKNQLYNQAISRAFANQLLWLLPVSELGAALLLLIHKTKLLGLWLSTVLLTIFTAYIALVLLGYFQRVPCSCGGVLKQLGWQAHLWFNLFFLSLSIIATFLQIKYVKQKKQTQ